MNRAQASDQSHYTETAFAYRPASASGGPCSSLASGYVARTSSTALATTSRSVLNVARRSASSTSKNALSKLSTAVCVPSTFPAPVHTAANHHMSLTPPLRVSSSAILLALPLALPLLMGRVVVVRRSVSMNGSSHAGTHSGASLVCAVAAGARVTMSSGSWRHG